MEEMKNRGVLIAGGTSGIGLAAARIFLSEGARVVLAGRSAARGEAALRDLAGGERASFLSADLREPSACGALARQAKAKGFDAAVVKYVKGDVDGDGAVTVKDAQKTLQIAVGVK